MEGEVKCNVMLMLFKDNDCFGLLALTLSWICLLELKAKTAKYDDVPSSTKGKACGPRKLFCKMSIW
jgi:hypothetical protein